MIPFSPPRIDDEICAEVVKTLKSGWITTGPKTKEFERLISEYCGNSKTVCLNSATAGLELMLRWFGVGLRDEVILPAYTYAATANVVIHCGARPVFVDVNPDDFNISIRNIEKAITEKTKVIMPVDFGGFPCDYEEIMAIAVAKKKMFKAFTLEQETLGRMMVLSDSAHSFGATYKGKKMGNVTDASVFSFHAVKNLTTAEGGAVALNLPDPFNNEEIYSALCVSSLHGQNKDALAKTQKGNWKYDIVEAGFKCNMTDISATIGIVELKRYDNETLPKRKKIVDAYNLAFAADQRFEIPLFETRDKTSSYHLYPLRIKTISVEQRDRVMQEIFNRNVSVNVHFMPVPDTSFYKNLGYEGKDYPVTLDNYQREISLPVFFDMSDEQIATVIKAVTEAVNAVC
jgi:dTDP-4-amino-4,6-dideoxygalactose transaminase